MKKTHLLAGLLLLSTALVGCDDTTSISASSISSSSETSSVTTSEDSSSTSSSSSSSSSTEISFPEDVTIDPDDAVSRGQSDGALLDFSIGLHLIVGKTYTFKFTPSSTAGFVGDVLNFEVSVEGIFDIVSNGNNSYSITALKAGGAIVSGYDDEGFLFYRNALNARDPLTREQIETYISSVDYWQSQLLNSIYNSYQVYFNPDLTGVFYATEMGSVYYPIYLTLTYSGFEEAADTNEYVYSVKATMEGGGAPAININEVRVSQAGDVLHVMETHGVIDFFFPVSVD